MRYLITILFLGLSLVSLAQNASWQFDKKENWNGDTSHFLNYNNGIQLKADQAGTSRLFYPYEDEIEVKKWEVKFQLDFAPSASNKIEVVLWANDETFNEALFIRLGESGTDDRLTVVERVDGVEKELIKGITSYGEVRDSILVRVERTGESYSLYSSTGGAFVIEGEFIPLSSIPKYYYGLGMDYTSTRTDKFYVYKFLLEWQVVLDTSAPSVVATNYREDTLTIQFDEKTIVNTNNVVFNYDFLISTVDSLKYDFLFQDLENDEYVFILNAVEDLKGNKTQELEFDFVVQELRYGDLLITEVMVDPVPAFNLPESEYIELYNNSAYIIDLADVKLAYDRDQVQLSNYNLQPGNYVLVSKDILQDVGDVLMIPSLFSFDNEKGSVAVLNTDDTLSHFSYNTTVYSDNFKRQGGWSIELIDYSMKCDDIRNTEYSSSLIGGTPNAKNKPDLIDNSSQAYILSLLDNRMEIYMDFLSDNVNFTMNEQSLTYQLDRTNLNYIVSIDNLDIGEIRTIEVIPEDECSFIPAKTLEFALTEQVAYHDIIISEVAFDAGDCSEFIEVTNVSDKLINLQDVSLVEYTGNKISDKTELTHRYRLLKPNESVVIAKDKTLLKSCFAVANSIESNIPTLSNDGFHLGLISAEGITIDSVQYNTDSYNGFLSDFSGTSLSRSNYTDEQEQQWILLSKPTPSSYTVLDQLKNKTITFSKHVRMNDPSTKNFSVSVEKEAMLSVRIFTRGGILLANILENMVINSASEVNWDMVDGTIGSLPDGIYILQAQLLYVDGEEKNFKQAFTLVN